MKSEGFSFVFFHNLLPILYFFYNLLLEKLGFFLLVTKDQCEVIIEARFLSCCLCGMFVFVFFFCFVFFFTLTTSRWNRVIVCLNYFFEKLSGPVAMINGLCGVKVLRGGILVILFDSCVV